MRNFLHFVEYDIKNVSRRLEKAKRRVANLGKLTEPNLAQKAKLSDEQKRVSRLTTVVDTLRKTNKLVYGV